MEKAKADELISDMNSFLGDDAAASGKNDPDDDGMPFESLDDFSADPVEFGEMAERMLQKVENLFSLTALYNRHSAKYLKACVLLEKGIKYLGSACLTRIALEFNKNSFPQLRQLTTMKLYRMASFNYRKLDTALTENLKKGNDLYPEVLDMVFRYYSLLQRLRSTEKKIYTYHTKKYYANEDFMPVVEGNAFAPNSWTKKYTQEKEEAPSFRQAPAFPVLKYARSAAPEENRDPEIKNQETGPDPSAAVQDAEQKQDAGTGDRDIREPGTRKDAEAENTLPETPAGTPDADSTAARAPAAKISFDPRTVYGDPFEWYRNLMALHGRNISPDFPPFKEDDFDEDDDYDDGGFLFKDP